VSVPESSRGRQVRLEWEARIRRDLGLTLGLIGVLAVLAAWSLDMVPRGIQPLLGILGAVGAWVALMLVGGTVAAVLAAPILWLWRRAEQPRRIPRIRRRGPSPPPEAYSLALGAATGTCQICGEGLEEGEPELVRCTLCHTPHHAECWEYFGGCSTFGCVAPSERRQR
jgi:hypothetical protein